MKLYNINKENYLNLEELCLELKINNQERVIIASNIASLKTQLKTQEQVIEKKTEQYLSALYKQNKAQSEYPDL